MGVVVVRDSGPAALHQSDPTVLSLNASVKIEGTAGVGHEREKPYHLNQEGRDASLAVSLSVTFTDWRAATHSEMYQDRSLSATP